MDKTGDLLLNLTCHTGQSGNKTSKLPARLPDGRRIEKNQKLKSKLFKTHQPISSGDVFIPKHKLPVLDEFGLVKPNDVDVDQKKLKRYSGRDNASSSQNTSNSAPKSILKNPLPAKPGDKRSERPAKPKQVADGFLNPATCARKGLIPQPKVIPSEVREVAGGLPSSFPRNKLKRLLDGSSCGTKSEPKKCRKSFVPGLNPRRKEKSPNVFSDTSIDSLTHVHPYLISALKENYDIVKLTRVQALAIPPLLQAGDNGQDYVVNSHVGSGKILSYVVPIINKLITIEPRIKRTDGVFALVLLPTRELAAKVNDIFVQICRSFTWIVPGLLVGGERKKSEKARLRKGINVLITTPGRLIDHIEHSIRLEFRKLKFFVIADAHKLIDPERIETTHKILNTIRRLLPTTCSNCLVTATITKKIEKLMTMILKNPDMLDAIALDKI